MNRHERQQRLNTLIDQRIAIPGTVYQHLDADTVPAELQSWSWHAALWPRPNASAGYNPVTLKAAQDAWDASERFVATRQELAAERDAQHAAAQAERDAEWQAEKDAATAAVTEELKRAYLRQPGTTEAGFEKALPELLEAKAREATLAGAGAVKSPISRAEMLK